MKIIDFSKDLNCWDQDYYFPGLSDEFSFYTLGTVLFGTASNEIEFSVYLLEFYKELNRLITITLGNNKIDVRLVMQLSGDSIHILKEDDKVILLFHRGEKVKYNWEEFFSYYFALKDQLSAKLLSTYPDLEQTNEFRFLFGGSGI